MAENNSVKSNGAAIDPAIARDRKLLLDAKAQGTGATFRAYVKLSGPGWLQSAITLGSGTLASSLYLGILAGFGLLWLQPTAMIMGIVMLSAIAYVTLSTGERPFQAINKHVNPVLGWSWALATMAANIVWCFPQFGLGTEAILQNLLPGFLGESAPAAGVREKLIVGVFFLVISGAVVLCYEAGLKGVKLFEIFLKILVGVVVVSFFGVIIRMALSGALDWGMVFGGFIPNLSLLSAPTASVAAEIAKVPPAYQDFWTSLVVDEQRSVMIAAVAAAVGINMTFLLPYSMLKRGWDKTFRGLAVFDLFTGLLIPFTIATSCVIVAAGSQFHYALLDETQRDTAEIRLVGPALQHAERRLQVEIGAEAFSALSAEEKTARVEALPDADKRLASLLVRRTTFALANSLESLTGKTVAQLIFGVGVVGIAMSTIIVLMLINGFVVTEMLGIEAKGWIYRFACFMPGIAVLAPILWRGETGAWMAVSASVFGFMLIPIAYLAFFMVINQKSLLGDNIPKGSLRVVWNAAMVFTVTLISISSLWNIWNATQRRLGSGWYGIGIFSAFIGLILLVHFIRRSKNHSTAGSLK